MSDLMHTIGEVPKDKKLIVFDLDGTLTESKVKIDADVAILLGSLLVEKKVGIVGGGALERFMAQVVGGLSQDARLDNLFVLPLNGGAFYYYQNGEWQKMYSHELSDEEKENIQNAFERIFREIGHVVPDKIYGEQI